VVIKQSINKSILVDRSVNEFRVFFWIGTYAEDYDNHFERVMKELQEMSKITKGSATMHYYMEFQYAESP